MSNKLLIIVGPSGSGKSMLEQNLLTEYPDIFYKWQQVSTRKPRENERPGNPYIFIQKETFLRMADVLVGRIGMDGTSSYNGDLYGSIPDFKEGKISTVILSEEGLLDFLGTLHYNKLPAFIDKYEVLGLDVDFTKLEKEARREGRDAEFFKKERNVLTYATKIYENGNGKYLEPSQVVEYLKEIGMIV